MKFSLVACALLILALLAGRATAPRSAGQRVQFGDVHGVLYVPEGKGPWPAVLCVYSMYQAPTTTTLTASALADAGLVVLDLDLAHLGSRGFDEYVEQVRAASTWLERRVEGNGVTILGHSMGAELAVMAAMTMHCKAVVAVGFPVAPGGPGLVALGVFDELHGPDEIRAAIDKAHSDARLVMLPRANHMLEIYDDELLQGVASIAGAEGLPKRLAPHLVWLGLAWASAFVLLVQALLALRAVLRSPRQLPLASAALMGLLAGSGMAVAPALSLALLVGTMGVDALPLDTSPQALARAALRYASAAIGVIGATLLLGASPTLLATPALIVPSLGFFPYAVPAMVAVAAFKASAPVLVGACVVAAIEVGQPGRTGAAFGRAAAQLEAGLQRLDLRPRGRVNWGQGLLAAVCMAVAVVAWRQTLRAGYEIDLALLYGLAGLLLRVCVLPLVLFLLVVRSAAWPRRT